MKAEGSEKTRWWVVVTFAIAMAWLEAAVVLYLRTLVDRLDPYQPNPYAPTYEYWLSIDRVVAAILLGIVTHDANLLVVYPSS